jgi:hypothetical protein
MSEEGVLLFIDAIEDDQAQVLLGEKTFAFPCALLPAGAREGSWLRLIVDASQQAKMGDEIDARRARLLRDDPGGKIKL